MPVWTEEAGRRFRQPLARVQVGCSYRFVGRRGRPAGTGKTSRRPSTRADGDSDWDAKAAYQLHDQFRKQLVINETGLNQAVVLLKLTNR